jgi:raffinose/stachyose/melibiose transport system permease protein
MSNLPEKKKKKKKKHDHSTVNSVLIRRPIQKCFPLFIVPTLACFVIGFVWPFLQGIYLSFCTFNTPRDAKWTGFQNYIKAFTDAGFRHAFWNTAAFAVVSIILINVLAFFIAYALTQNIRGANLFRTVFFMPNLIGGVVLGYIWSMIFDAILKGYNTYLTANATYGFWGLVILVAWQQIGYMMIIYIAGLQAVPGDMLEAAKIDGASCWQTLTKVIIPNVMPSITICTFLTLTNSFKLFDQNLALTGGAPSVMLENTKVNMTELLALNIFSTYNINKNYHGAAQAKAVVFFILVAVLALAQQRATRSKEVQQ